MARRPKLKPTRIQLFSDLHADVRNIRPPVLADGVDVVVVAGDTCQGPRRALGLLRALVPLPMPIVTLLGNHEHYRGEYSETIAEARATAPQHGVTFLENDVAVVAGVRFIGATLWTDYCLDGAAKQSSAMAAAAAGMNDHRVISWREENSLRTFSPSNALAIHEKTRAFIERSLAIPFEGPSVVLTHHAPHPQSIGARFARSQLNPAFASDLTEVMQLGRPTLWLHGHVHGSKDYKVGSTRVVCNPHGYGVENLDFGRSLVVEVPQ